MSSETTIRPRGPQAPKGPKPETRPPETTERGQVLQWRPRPGASTPDREADEDFFDFPHSVPPVDTITSRIFAAERRPLPAKQARTPPLAPWDGPRT